MANNPILDQASATSAPSVTPVSDKLQLVEQALATSTARTTSAITDLEGNLVKTKSAGDVIEASIKEISSAAQVTQLAKQTAELKAQNATADVVEVAAAPDQQIALMSLLAEDNARVQGLLNDKQDIVDDEHTGIQIIDGIINEFRSFQTDLEIEAAQNQLKATENEIAGIAAAGESFARLNILSKRTLNQGVIEANYKAIGAEGFKQAAEAEIQNLHANASAMVSLSDMDSRLVQNTLAAFQFEADAEGRKLTRETHKLRKEQMVIEREKMKIALPAAKIALESAKVQLERAKGIDIPAAKLRYDEAQQAVIRAENTRALMADEIRKGQGVLNLPIEEIDVVIEKLNNPVTRESYIKLQEIGNNPNAPIDDNPYAVRETLGDVAPTGGLSDTRGTDALRAISAEQAEQYKASESGKAPRDEATLEADFNFTADTYMRFKASNIVEGDVTNPYQAPPFSIIEQNASVKNTPLYQKVLKAKGMKEFSPQKIVDHTIAGLQAKSISTNEAAAGIKAIFDAAVLNNNLDHGGFKRVALTPQTSYITGITLPFTSFDKLKILTRVPTEASKLAVKTLAGGTSEEGLAGLEKAFPQNIELVDMMKSSAIEELIAKIMTSAPPIKDTQTE